MTHPDGNQEVHDVLGVEKGALHQKHQQPNHKVPKPPDGSQASKEEEPAPELKVLQLRLSMAVQEQVPVSNAACPIALSVTQKGNACGASIAPSLHM